MNEKINSLIEFPRKFSTVAFYACCTATVATVVHPLMILPLLSLSLSMSINSVKLKDSRNKSHRSSGFYREETRTRSFDHFFVAHSTLKAVDGGKNSSHNAMEFYNDLGAAKRARMIAQFKNQE